MRSFVVVVALAACQTQDIATTFDPCSPLAIAAPGASDAELESLDQAVGHWGDVLPVAIETGEAAEDAALTVHFDAGDTFYRALYLDERAEIHLGRDRLDPADYPLALAHELGHAFGLQHVASDDRGSVMNVGNLEIAPTGDDAEAVRALWPACEAAP